MEIDLGKLEHVDPRTLWKNEPGAFTPWLANNTGLLGDRLRAELYIDVGDVTENKSIFDTLQAQKATIEQKTGILDWERLDQRRASRISLVHQNTSIDAAASQPDEIRTWLVQALLKMKSAFGPLLVTQAPSRSAAERGIDMQ